MYIQFCLRYTHRLYRAYYSRLHQSCYLDYWNGTKWIPIDNSPYHTNVAEFIQYVLTIGV